METLSVNYRHDPYVYKTHPHVVGLEVNFYKIGNEETIRTVVRGRKFLSDKTVQAEAWLIRQGYDYKVEVKANSEIRKFLFANKAEAMLFKLAIT